MQPTPCRLRRLAAATLLAVTLAAGAVIATPAPASANNDAWYRCRDVIASAYWNHGSRYPEDQDQFEEDAVTLCGDLYRPVPGGHGGW